MIICANDGCEEKFHPKTHNQKYHSDECCRVATNKRIMEKYYAKRDQRRGKVRYCKSCEKTRLSRYNDTDTCSPCDVSRQAAANDAVAEMLQMVALAS